MPLIETEGLVLKSYNLAEADRIVVILTREQGVIRGVAKGAKRLRSKFGSGVEPYSIVRIAYFQKDAVELVSLQSIELISSYFDAAGDPDFLQKFAYLSELLITFSPPHDPNETLYRMVKSCIETAASDPALLDAVGVYFQLWLLRLSGYMPDWSRCDECRRAFDDNDTAAVRANSHLICPACRRSSMNLELGAQSRMIAATARRVSPSDFAATYANAELRNLTKVLRQLISQAAGREVAGEVSLAV